MTHRGSPNLAHFVRHGCPRAEIKIWLHNEGEEAFRSDHYGDAIVFERVISVRQGKDDKVRLIHH